MTYLPLIGVLALAGLVWAIGRRPFGYPVQELQLYHLRGALAVASVIFVVWGVVHTFENGARELEDRRLLSGDGARAVAEVFRPSGFLGIGDAVVQHGPCDRGRVRFTDDQGVERLGYVRTEGHDLREGTQVLVAYDPDEPEGYQPMTAVDDRCRSRPIDSLATSAALLLIGGQAVVLRRYAVTEPRPGDR